MRSTATPRSIGERISARRRRIGITQGELGATVCLGPRTISDIERGKRAPGVLLPRLAEALGLHPQDLTAEFDPIEPAGEEHDLFSAYRALPDEGRAYVRSLVTEAAAGRIAR
ncbi:helix-turn-helix domain-containing protein [Methylobacterium isbiliense]|uniref:HTH cro/C1-type domain-containing protein n=1 Tax=Methylobacterium isbiliense TaxID=315478 RepID=A0ABQ4SE54_9HYPH|nr:helix-turn-helix transcriptional regulator [Methylobacterium isbiliense]MDN3622561.1 helix-turn-helix transcriptional regulator [Methylobacterium isbiliense]GJE01455.1 hypothetical protein GMJLKIPL_3386 [Methylobacterium isbiliense]